MARKERVQSDQEQGKADLTLRGGPYPGLPASWSCLLFLPSIEVRLQRSQGPPDLRYWTLRLP
jgi:hypothetical protein